MKPEEEATYHCSSPEAVFPAYEPSLLPMAYLCRITLVQPNPPRPSAQPGWSATCCLLVVSR